MNEEDNEERKDLFRCTALHAIIVSMHLTIKSVDDINRSVSQQSEIAEAACAIANEMIEQIKEEENLIN